MRHSRSIVLAGLLMGLLGSQAIALPVIAQSPIAQNGVPNLAAIQSIQKAAEALQQGRYEAAIESFNKLLNDNPNRLDPMLEHFALSGMGLAYMALGQYSNSIDVYEKSLSTIRQLKDPKLESSTLHQLATAHIAMGSYAKGFNSGEQSLAIARSSGDRDREVAILNFMGLSYNQLGNTKKALAFFKQSLPIAQTLKDRSQLAYLLTYRGGSYRLLGDYPRALADQQQALSLFRGINDRGGEQTVLANLGNLAFTFKQYPAAIQYQEQILKLSRELDQNALRRLSQRELEQYALLNLSANYHALGDHRKAIEFATQSLPIAQQRKDPYGEGLAITSLGFGYLRTGRLAEAETALRSAAKQRESMRVGLTDLTKVAFSNTQIQTVLYEALQETLVQQKQPEAALEAAERGRSRAFIDLLASRLQNKSQTEIQALSAFPNLDTIRQIAKAQNATLVEYSFVDDKKLLYIWVVKPTGEIQFKTSKLESMIPLGELIQQSRSSIAITGDKPPETDVPKELNLALNKLHQSLIAPIASALPTDPNQRVIFLPQGELFLVPFAALRDDQGKYLIEKHTISTAPSIHTLALTREKAKHTARNGNILVVGDPTMPKIPGVTLSDLPGARAEAIAIAQLLKTTPLIGNQATKAAVLQQMNQASIIHLATHGLLETLKGDIPGAIVLASSGTDNGFLTSSEIFDLKINPDLLVLSACDTGGGEITGDGVIGLSRSFIAAGAPSLLVSLWAVNDNSTSALMQSFYQTLKTNPNKAQALRSSMLSTMKKYPNPRYWAAFTLVGES
jgi:CHAT domain-containing protein